MKTWLLFNYKVPNEPSARRVFVWRKLKGMGAILLSDAVWVLPANACTREKLQWLVGEIKEMDGEAILGRVVTPIPTSQLAGLLPIGIRPKSPRSTA